MSNKSETKGNLWLKPNVAHVIGSTSTTTSTSTASSPTQHTPSPQPDVPLVTSIPTVPGNSFAVIQHQHCDVPYYKCRQEIFLRHCVQKAFVSTFYGEFSLFDKSGRLIGTSKNSVISFLKDDLQTECSKVLYDVMLLQPECQTLKNQYRVKDPGLYFNFAEVFIEFHGAFDVDNTKTFKHIPVFYNITNVWNPDTKALLF